MPKRAELEMEPYRTDAHRPERIPGRENVVVRTSGVHGRGLFALRDFAKGEHVIQYMGELLGKKEGNRRTDAQWEKGRVYTFELNKRHDIDGSPAWNVARLANFSCDPNCESHNEGGRAIWIVALKPIRAGDEITYDYNFDFTEPPPVCKCGAAKCRGYIVGSDHIKDLNRWLRKQGKATVTKRGKAAGKNKGANLGKPARHPAGATHDPPASKR